MADYPAALTSFTNPIATDKKNSTTVPHATQHADANNEIVAIQTELGIDPAGSSATVVARLEAIDTSIATNVTAIATKAALGANSDITSLSALAGATGDIVTVDNGTGRGIFISQSAILATTKHALYVLGSNGYNQTNADSALVKIHQDDADSTEPALEVTMDNAAYVIQLNCAGGAIQATIAGTGIGYRINSTSTGSGILIDHATNPLAGGAHLIYATSDADNVNSGGNGSALIIAEQLGSGSSEPVIEAHNDGTGAGIYIDQDGNGRPIDIAIAGSKGVLITGEASSLATEGALTIVSPSGSTHCVTITHASANHVLNLTRSGVSSDAGIILNDSSATGTGTGFEINQDGTGHSIYIHADGNLATSKYALYIDNNGTPTDGATRAIRFDGCADTDDDNVACVFTATRGPTGAQTDIQGFLEVNIDGTARYMPYW